MFRRFGFSSIAILLLSVGGILCADVIPTTDPGEPIVPGEWHGSLDKALELGAATGTPVIGFWSDSGCSVCKKVINGAINVPAFDAWRQERRVLLVSRKDLGADGGKALYNWVKAAARSDGNTKYPYIRIYWKDRDGNVLADYRFSANNERTPERMIARFEQWIADFEPQTLGEGRFASTPGLQAEPTTTSIPLPLIRENGSMGLLTNEFTFVQTLAEGGSNVWHETLVWDEGQVARNLDVPIENHWVGGNLSITLSAEDQEDQVVSIEMVDAQAITTHNPRFIGAPLEFGEWSMDIDAATNMMANASGEAFTFLFFTGTLWCPYCIGFENDILDQEEFLEFARTNQIALVTIENFRRNTTPPSLLNYAVFQGAAGDRRNGSSGASYLSRHGIDVDVATAVQERNLALQQLLKLPGANPDKPIGYPTILLLRKDGSIAGRFGGYYVTTDTTTLPSTQSFDLALNMRRLHEFIDLARDPDEAGEELNNQWERTQELLALNEQCQASLRAMDQVDFYQLASTPGVRGIFAVSGAESLAVTLSLHDASGEVLERVAGDLVDGLSLTASGSKAASFLSVRSDDVKTDRSNPDNSVFYYTLESGFMLEAQESASALALEPLSRDGTFTAEMTVEAGLLYYFEVKEGELGLPEGSFEEHGDNLYSFTASGVIELAVNAVTSASELSWQIWNPGMVGFATATAEIAEAETKATILVERFDGSSGAFQVVIKLDSESSTATAGEDFVDIFGAEGLLLEWQDGESGTQVVELPLLPDLIYEGTETIQLSLEVIEGFTIAAEGRTSFVLSILDDDLPIVGRLKFDETVAPFIKLSPLTLVAREGTVLPLTVTRIEGVNTEVAADVLVSAGVATPAVLTWGHNSSAVDHLINLQLPMLSEVQRGQMTVTLSPDDSIKTVPRLNAITIQLVAADAPSFAVESVQVPAITRVQLEQFLALSQTTGGRITFKRLNGSLPSGLTLKYDENADAAVLSGTPRKAGTFSAIYQVVERRGTTNVAGGIIQLNFTVQELSAVNGATAQALAAEGAIVDQETKFLIGTAVVKISKTGRVSAKCKTLEGNSTFSATNWDSCDAAGNLEVAMVRRNEMFVLSLAEDGTLTAVYNTPALEQSAAVSLTTAPWSRLAPADSYEGLYTASLTAVEKNENYLAPTGYSYLTLSLTKTAARSGKMKYAGRLADGSTITGSGVLLPQPDNQEALLPLFVKKRTYQVGALLHIRANAREDYLDNPSAISTCGTVLPYWNFDQGWEDTAFLQILDICGGYYNSADTFDDYFEWYEGGGAFQVKTEYAQCDSELYGLSGELPQEELEHTATALKLLRGSANPTKLRISVNKKTGVFTGSFQIPFTDPKNGRAKNIRATYAGVLLPGWVGDCGCGDDGLDLPEKPLGLGAFWFNDKVEVDVAGSNRKRTLTIKRGQPVIIEKGFSILE